MYTSRLIIQEQGNQELEKKKKKKVYDTKQFVLKETQLELAYLIEKSNAFPKTEILVVLEVMQRPSVHPPCCVASKDFHFCPE